ADLAMTHSEAGAVMAARGTELDPAVLDLLVHRTEGWPAALYLAALAMEEEPLAGHGLAEFTGGDRFVADYIADELLAPLSPDMVAFLTRTSVLDRLSGALCDHVLERSGSARLLKKLSRMNLMLVPLDRSDDEYRYHRLFAEALRVELSRREPELAPILHTRASAWYEHRGDSKRAIEHAIAGGDAARAGALLWSNAATYAGYGRRDDLDGWLARFSHGQVASSPTLALTAAAQAFVAGDRSLLEHWTAAALRALDGSETDGARGALEAEILILRAVAEESVTSMGDCAAAAAPVDSPWRALACLLRGVALHLSGERAEARELLEEGARHSAAAAPHIQALCLAQLALLAIERQDWAAAESLAGRARGQVERAGLREYATSALVYAVASQVEAQGGRVETSQEDLRHASWLLTRGDLGPWYEAECRVALACAALRLGDTPGARTLLSEAERQLERSPDARVPRAWVAACQVQAELSGSAAGTASLTTAELRVLQFLPTHLSFPEMAERLYVSANTVKTHARSVYRKLDASSRGEAVVRARDAGLLDQQTSHAGVGTVRLVGIG
ncbi:MAG TPA: LuxR C-terminal-related transcriptional regulator, partial [Thermoleophilaceae bacterium]|nr:LuxR C-terminal-related transcriptional regulator [Thermoleophilaceae bacterium]